MQTFEENILFINSKTGLFLTKSIMSSFDEMEIKYDAISIENMNYDDYSFSYAMIMAENFMNDNSHLIKPLKSYLEKNRKKLIVVGSEMEKKKLNEILGNELIALFLSRVLSPRLISENVSILLEDGRKKFEKSNIKKHILVVDDSGVMLRMIMSWLEPYYKITLANSAKIAKAVIDREMPDMILLDYEMPGCTGADFFGELKTDINTKEIPVVFLPSKDDKDTVKSVLEMKPQGYILKLMPRNEIIDRVMDLVEKYC